jgi:cell filamentation protein
LDLILKKRLKKCVDWSKISKQDYMNAMKLSTTNGSVLKTLLEKALTTKINDREMFMKGIDYSYYYEEND